MLPLALIVEPGATPSSVMLTMDMLNVASRFPEAEGCRLDILSVHGGAVRLSPCVSVDTQTMPEVLAGYAAVILPGFFAADGAALIEQLQTVWQPVIARLRSLPGETLLAGSCYGTFVLAESGVLDGATATTPWWLQAEFRQRYPHIALDADAVVVDSGRYLTAGAMTAHTDLTLHVLRRLLGAALVRSVSRIMLVDGARDSQRPFMALRRQFDDPLIQQAADWLAAHGSVAVTTAALAEALHVSYRTLHRRFQAAAGMPPIAYVQDLRVEHAKELLESTRMSLEQIVARVGYSDVPAFRRLFVRRAGLSPAQYRQRFRRG
ncbi:helix-turn-helix domain-containing protein [Rhodocyclus tenuis]|uniref:Helix-turn-helix domain-containing protein n=1 Tax=Rhodocyclus gracilis TaxID=2929842 RepID=A0ABX0WGW0_9RHOO|nr:helix-turn-helix domain-containing protein [Rhodocyclus gracilis]NJA87648.1 helix-turn-helix domain-containing protein [Rhodocyclus gracilis]